MLLLKTKRPSTLTGRNVRLSNLLISSRINNMCKLKFLLKGLECNKNTQMKACNITVH